MQRVLIADDHLVVRRGLRAILESQPGWEIVAEAATGEEAVEEALRVRPDIAILDFSLPDLDGLQATRRIRQSLRTEVLIFTMHESEQIIRDLLRAGAKGYILKTDADLHLLAALNALSHHRPYLTWRASEALLDSLKDLPSAPHIEGLLTAREREVVTLIADGLSNKRAALHLDVSVKTIESHRAAAMRKLGISSTAELVRYAVRSHLISA
ncbi:response regulator transcription factor [Microvirga flavescens]|uniref:response regulator transcription factor n=1 Tax=Microvirga flavescens TaxID=2249811 RepID=UPI000DD79FB8|nr:response regulator transcription factor [Microvirga flavescens]